MTTRATADLPQPMVASLASRRAALGITLLMLAAGISTLPFGVRHVGEVDALVAVSASVAAAVMLVSATMLKNQYRVTHHTPFATLSLAYSVTAILIVPYMVSFPHLFSPNGFGLGPQASAWLWIVYHGAFVILMAGYVWSDSYFSRKAVGLLEATAVTLCGVLAVGAVLVFHGSLPVLITPAGYTQLYHVLVQQSLLNAACIVLAAFVARNALRHTTQLWMMVVVAVFGIEIVLHADVVS